MIKTENTDNERDFEQQREQIIQLAMKDFRHLGVRSMSVDDVSRQLGISKKTFYKYFANKEELVEAVLQSIRNNVVLYVTKFFKGKSAIECIRSLIELHAKVDSIHKDPPFEYDVKKYYPNLYKQHIQYVHDFTRQTLENHLRQGIEEGIYRKDLDVEMYALLFSLIQLGVMRNEDNICEVNPHRIIRTFFDSFFRSILSDEGMTEVEKEWKIKTNK